MRILIPAALLLVAARAQEPCPPLGPCYSAASVVNAASFLPGAAPGTLLSIFGSGLAWEPRSRTLEDAAPGIGGVIITVDGLAAIVLYVSPVQVNFLVPGSAQPGPVAVRLSRDGAVGPTLALTLAPYAPALFTLEPGIVAAARQPGWELVNRDRPARPGDTLALYATGLGPLQPAAGDYELPLWAAEIAAREDLRILLNGVPAPKEAILYAGCAPTYYGLYQINLRLPDDTPPDPEVRLAIGETLSPPGVRLPVGPAGMEQADPRFLQ